jgi:hypothetical protein
MCNNFFAAILYVRQWQHWHQLREGSKVTKSFLPTPSVLQFLFENEREKIVRGKKT